MSSVFLNGEFVERTDARVSAFDAGVQHGVGLFETVLAVRRDADEPGLEPAGVGAVVHLREHLERLAVSARALGLMETVRAEALGEAVRRTCERAWEELPGAARLRVRLTITGGDLNLLELAKAGAEPARQAPTILIAANPATPYPGAMFERGTGVTIADLRVNPLDPTAGHKTLNYWARLRELQAAAGKRAGEALVFQVTNHLAGGCVSNAMIVRGGEIVTPIARGEEIDGQNRPAAEGRGGVAGAYMPSPVLPGIARKWVVDFADAEGVPVRRRMVTIDDVLGADEVFLTNSSWGVLPVVKVEAEAIGDGVVGALSKRLVAAWGALTRVSDPR